MSVVFDIGNVYCAAGAGHCRVSPVHLSWPIELESLCRVEKTTQVRGFDHGHTRAQGGDSD
jgi:hypothetical protein